MWLNNTGCYLLKIVKYDDKSQQYSCLFSKGIIKNYTFVAY